MHECQPDLTLTCIKYCHANSHLEEESISHWVAETEDKVFLGMLRYSLDNAVLHPQRVFVNAVVVDTWTAIVFIQEEGAALKNAQKERS